MMNPDLSRLIELQQLETAAEDARRRIADAPRRSQDLESRLEGSRGAVANAKQRLSDSQTARRAIEKDLAAIQGRLSKYRDQLMEVKTNREYQAMQKEIEVAQHDVRALEDRILERMLEGDEMTAAVKAAEATLKDDEKTIAAERVALTREVAALEQQLSHTSETRAALVAKIEPRTLAEYERIAKGRKGIAVAEARDGVCTVCHVRLRPQMYNEVRCNESIIFCDSCQRILYFVPAPQPVQPSA
jgi:predicted  nucleic acid-binding Zn-ribbon protein